MIRFQCDYGEGCHQKILDKLNETNLIQTIGYSEDEYTNNARLLIKKVCKSNDIDIHFLVGGTQTNLTFIASALRSYEGVLSAVSGHINVHETGAIEATGHKVLTLPSEDGKITAEQVEQAFQNHINDETPEHVVRPKMVYISHPTENGTTYTKDELKLLYNTCKRNDLYLYVDGARLGYGLTYPNCDLTMNDFVKYSDAFYIGGTKVGALFGEALVIVNNELKTDFRYNIKQRGGLLAKGRLLGIQFETLFTDNLYFEISRSTVEKALKIREAFEQKGIKMLFDSKTNQQFPILTEVQVIKLREKYVFYKWCNVEDKVAVRFVTSFATQNESIEKLIEDINNL